MAIFEQRFGPEWLLGSFSPASKLEVEPLFNTTIQNLYDKQYSLFVTHKVGPNYRKSKPKLRFFSRQEDHSFTLKVMKSCPIFNEHDVWYLLNDIIAKKTPIKSCQPMTVKLGMLTSLAKHTSEVERSLYIPEEHNTPNLVKDLIFKQLKLGVVSEVEVMEYFNSLRYQSIKDYAPAPIEFDYSNVIDLLEAKQAREESSNTDLDEVLEQKIAAL